jgi:DNA-binding CsgD family transcriptional regulator
LDIDTFPHRAIAALRRVVHAPFGSYNEISPRATLIRYVVEPAEALVSGLQLSLRQYMREQPVLAHYVRTGDGSARKLSDFLSQHQFHRLGIYAENYRRAGVEYQMSLMIDRPRRNGPTTIALALDRGRDGKDFVERDRLAFNIVHSHLAGALANAEMMSSMQRRCSISGDRAEGRHYETVVLGRGARHAMSPGARRWLREYFDERPSRDDHLPDTLLRWARKQVACLESSEAMPEPATPFMMEFEHKRLVVRLVLNSPSNILVLEEERSAADRVALQRLGLTPREAQVLHWLAQGKSNPEIGIILGAKERTVAKHVQRINAKLGVGSRLAAVTRALALDWPASWGPMGTSER